MSLVNYCPYPASSLQNLIAVQFQGAAFSEGRCRVIDQGNGRFEVNVPEQQPGFAIGELSARLVDKVYAVYNYFVPGQKSIEEPVAPESTPPPNEDDAPADMEAACSTWRRSVTRASMDVTAKKINRFQYWLVLADATDKFIPSYLQAKREGCKESQHDHTTAEKSDQQCREMMEQCSMEIGIALAGLGEVLPERVTNMRVRLNGYENYVPQSQHDQHPAVALLSETPPKGALPEFIPAEERYGKDLGTVNADKVEEDLLKYLDELGQYVQTIKTRLQGEDINNRLSDSARLTFSTYHQTFNLFCDAQKKGFTQLYSAARSSISKFPEEYLVFKREWFTLLDRLKQIASGSPCSPYYEKTERRYKAMETACLHRFKEILLLLPPQEAQYLRQKSQNLGLIR